MAALGGGELYTYTMNSMELVIPLHSLYWSIHTKDESKCSSTSAFIFDVNVFHFCFHLWCELTLALWYHNIVWSPFS